MAEIAHRPEDVKYIEGLGDRCEVAFAD